MRVGIAIAMIVVVGLIVCSAIYFFDFFDVRRGTIPIKTLTTNPEAYANQQVTVIGKVMVIINLIVDDEGYYFAVTNLPGNFIPDISSRYKVSGKVVHVQTVPGTVEWMWALMYMKQDNYWAIKVSDIVKI